MGHVSRCKKKKKERKIQLKEIIYLMSFKCFCSLQKNKTTSFDSVMKD